MVPSKFRAKTGQAAEIAGLSYEGFRSWLKRGLLKNTGPTLAKFYAAQALAEVSDSKRWQWSEFGFADLCGFRLMRVLLDAGLSWKAACEIVSHRRTWYLQLYAQQEDEQEGSSGAITPLSRYLGIRRLSQSKPSDEVYVYDFYTKDGLAADLEHGLVSAEHMILVDLQRLRGEVVSCIKVLSNDGDVVRETKRFA